MPALVLSPKAAIAIRRVINSSRSIPVRPSRGGEGGRVPLLVKCTSATAAAVSGIGAQCYPAVVVDPMSDELVTDQPTLGDMWLTVMDGTGAAVPVSGKQYLGLMSGEHTEGSDTRPRVFAVGGTGTLQSVEVVTNVECIAGELVVTYSDLTGRDLVLS